MPPLTLASQPYWPVMLMDFLSRWWPGCGKQNHPSRNKALPKHWFCCTTFCEFKARQKGLWMNEELFLWMWHGIVKHTISTFKVWVFSQPSLCSQRVCGLSLCSWRRERETQIPRDDTARLKDLLFGRAGGDGVKEVFIWLRITWVLSSDKGYGIFITCLTLNQGIDSLVKNPMNSRTSAQRPLIEGQIEVEWKSCSWKWLANTVSDIQFFISKISVGEYWK